MSSIEGVSAGGAVAGALAQKEAYAVQDVQVAMLKKAMDVQSANAMALLDSAAPVPASKLPSNLGQNVNTSV